MRYNGGIFITIIIMILFELAFAVIVWVCLSRHSDRIKELEKKLKGTSVPRTSTEAVSPPATVASAASTPEPVLASHVEEQSPQAAIQKENSSEEGSGRLLGKIGIGAVILGISFFLKYAFDKDWISPSGRVMIGIFIGVILLALGQYLRKKYIRYSDLLMGGGIAVLYLSLFSAHFFYHLMSSTTAGVLMFCVTALAFAISIVNATPTLAMVSVIGGFLTPFLVGTGTNTMAQTFVYLTILNLGILAISFFKKWPQLILAAFVGSFINFITWFLKFYRPEALGPTMVFISVTFLIFLFASVARAISAKATTDPLNYLLLGANALFFSLAGYTILQSQHESILGFAAVLVALVYMGVALLVNKANPEDKALNIFLPGLAVTFLSVAVPLQFSGPWIAVAWFVESVALYVIASAVSNRGFQIMGVVVYILGLLNFFAWNFPNLRASTFTPFFNSHFIIILLAVGAAYAIAFMYHRFGSSSVEVQKRGIVVFLVIANVLTLYGLSSQIMFYHNAKSIKLSTEYQSQQSQNQLYSNNSYDTSSVMQQASVTYREQQNSIANRSHTFVSILWAVYAAILTIIGFSGRLIAARRLGLALFIITALKVVVDVWSLGQLYRIVSFIVFGIIALAASFAYAKYKDRLKEVV